MVWTAGEINLVFYEDDSRISGKDQEWVQDKFTMTVSMFLMMGIGDKLEKTNAMVCTPRFIWEKWGETAYKRWATGERANFWERKEMWVICTKCVVTEAAS